MDTVSTPLAMVKGPSKEMVNSFVTLLMDAINTHCDYFDIDEDETILRIMCDVDDGIETLSGLYPDMMGLEFDLTYDGAACNFIPLNDYTEQVALIMQNMVNIP